MSNKAILWPLILLLASVALFWGLPALRGPQTLKIEWANTPSTPTNQQGNQSQ